MTDPEMPSESNDTPLWSRSPFWRAFRLEWLSVSAAFRSEWCSEPKRQNRRSPLTVDETSGFDPSEGTKPQVECRHSVTT